MKNKVLIICGGKSIEHEISILTSFEILNSLKEEYEGYIAYISKENKWYVGEYLQHKEHYKDLNEIINKGKEVRIKVKNKRYYLGNNYRNYISFDLAILAVHGKGMEDGTLASLMEYYDIPYVGNSVLSSSIGQDKWLCKFLLHNINVSVVPSFFINPNNYDETYVENKANSIGYPLIVKANNLGSSIGIKKVDNYNELFKTINEIGMYDDKVLIEKCLLNFKELNQAVTTKNNEIIFSGVDVIFPKEFYDYEDKYINPHSKKEKCNDLDLIKKVSKLSSKIYKHLGLSSIVRIDYLYDLDNDKLYFSEVNTIPGSLSRRLFEENQIMFDDLLENEIHKALSVNFQKRNNIRVLENKISSSVIGNKFGK